MRRTRASIGNRLPWPDSATVAERSRARGATGLVDIPASTRCTNPSRVMIGVHRHRRPMARRAGVLLPGRRGGAPLRPRRRAPLHLPAVAEQPDPEARAHPRHRPARTRQPPRRAHHRRSGTTRGGAAGASRARARRRARPPRRRGHRRNRTPRLHPRRQPRDPRDDPGCRRGRQPEHDHRPK
jgi:hypothetical protein